MSRCMKLFSRELIVDNLGFCNPKIKMGEDVNIVLPALLDCKKSGNIGRGASLSLFL